MVSIVAGFLLLQRPHVQSLVQTERAFAQMGAEKGVRDSFLHYFRDDAVAFGKDGPHNAPKKLRASASPKGKREAKLVWEPICADAAGSGDLGYTFGPSSVRKISDDSLIPDTTGVYFSVWARKKGGPWRVVADMGNENPAPPEGSAFKEGPLPLPSAAVKAVPKDPRQIEKALAKLRGTELQNELKSLLADDACLLSKNVCPWSKGGAMDAPTELTYVGGGVSRDSTLGYAYGTYKTAGAAHGNYLRVYRRADKISSWFIVVNCQEPIENEPA